MLSPTGFLSRAGRYSAWRMHQNETAAFSTFGVHGLLFAAQASNYALFRPNYPPIVAAAVVEHHAKHSLDFATAVDVAAGSGQASWCITPFFGSVLASDASPQQVAMGIQKQQQTVAEIEPAMEPQLSLAHPGYQEGSHLEVSKKLIARAQCSNRDPSKVQFVMGSSEQLGMKSCSADMIV